MTIPRWHCVDCGFDTIALGDYYMVGDALWAASGLGPHDGVLCLQCLGQRIGRWLTAADFTAVFPKSWPDHVAERLPVKGKMAS